MGIVVSVAALVLYVPMSMVFVLGGKKVIFGLPGSRQPVRFVYFSAVYFSLFGDVRPGVQVFSSGGVAAAQVPFRLVLLENEPHLFIQQPVDLPKTFGQILVHCAFGDAETLGRRADGGIVLNDPPRQLTRPLVSVRLHHAPLPFRHFIYMCGRFVL